LALTHKASLGILISFSVPKTVQTKFAPIIHLSISYHCVDDKFLIPKLYFAFGSFLEQVILSQVVVIGVVGGGGKWVGVLNGGGKH